MALADQLAGLPTVCDSRAPFLSSQPCIVMLAMIPATAGLLALRFARAA
jgi:hypothetical protein